MQNEHKPTYGSTAGSPAPAGSTLPATSDGRATGEGMDRQQVAERARQLASEAQHRAGERVRSGLDSGKSRAAGAIREVGDALRQGSRENDEGMVHLLSVAGDQANRVADYLEQTDVRELTRNVERFARRQPALFLGGAFLLGLAAARFVKSTREDDGSDDWRSDGRSYDRERPIAGYTEPSATASSTSSTSSYGASASSTPSYGASSSSTPSYGTSSSSTPSYGASASPTSSSPSDPSSRTSTGGSMPGARPSTDASLDPSRPRTFGNDDR